MTVFSPNQYEGKRVMQFFKNKTLLFHSLKNLRNVQFSI